MSRKKHSMLKTTMLITLIMVLNILGVSYGHWQDRFTGKITAQTGYIELSFERESGVIEKKSEAFSEMRATLEDDEKTITVTGKIKSGEDGEFELGYSIFNHGSLPVEFDGIQIENLQMEGVTAEERKGSDIKPGYSVSDSIVVAIDTSEIDYSSAEDFESEGIEESTDIYKFEIVLTYKIGSWTEDLLISGEIEVVPSSAVTTLIVPMPAMTPVPIFNEIIPTDNQVPVEGELPGDLAPDPTQQDSSDATEEGMESGADEQEQTNTGETTIEADTPETAEGNSESATGSEDEEESPSEQEQTDDGGTTEEDDEQEAVGDDSKPESEGEDEGEGGAAVEADAPEAIEGDSEPESAGDDGGEGPEDQGQTGEGETRAEDDSGEPQPDAGENN